jgi:serine/threonine protein kinase
MEGDEYSLILSIGAVAGPKNSMSDSESILTPGTVLAERYRLTKEIGRGGFGMVYLARQLNMDRDVAIKILPPKFMSISDVVERFRREARLASRLRHPNTITVHDYGKHDNLLFIVMEYLEGEDLADVLMRKSTVPMDRILHIGHQVLKSLNEAHEHNIVHRDLKPENIFLTQVGGEEDYVKVLDFGIAKLAMPEVAADSDQKSRQLTMSGSTVGTPTYMSPEQAAGEDVDELTDLYALGVILYELACGRPPFRDDNPVKVMRSHLFEEIPRFPEGPLRDSRFEWVIRKALTKDKKGRYDSATDFLKALDITPTKMLERADDGEEPATIELPDLELSNDDRDSGDIAFERTDAYEVEGSDALSLRGAHRTDAALAAQTSSAPETEESVPFESIPAERNRDRVPQGAANSSLTDGSGLTARSDLHERQSPPKGFKASASSSSILTVLEPGTEEDVILLTNKKDDEADLPASSPPRRDTPPQDAPAKDAPAQNPPTKAESKKSDWTWGENRTDMSQESRPRPGSDELDLADVANQRTGAQKAILAVLFIVFATAAIASYLHFSGQLDIFSLF